MIGAMLGYFINTLFKFFGTSQLFVITISISLKSINNYSFKDENKGLSNTSSSL
jgi:hypothetical protein